MNKREEYREEEQAITIGSNTRVTGEGASVASTSWYRMNGVVFLSILGCLIFEQGIRQHNGVILSKVSFEMSEGWGIYRVWWVDIARWIAAKIDG